ncbi:MAG: ketoacyl-ACP synthase III [Firmicutes bacterium]|nr:ketoacyl-ACP synthase III [Bacillota bacterium]
MDVKQNQIRLVSTGHYAPPKILTNADLEKIVDTSDEWITTRTGIKERRIAENEANSDLATKAALAAIEKANYDIKKIDLIIVATFTPDYKSPNVANFVQAKLGLNDRPITAFDINAACTGFIYALNVAAQMLSSGNYQSALVIGSEKISKVTDYTDRNTCVLFGDGAGAVILEPTKNAKPWLFFTASRGDQDLILYVDEYVHMDGQKVYQFASKAIDSSIRLLLDFDGMKPQDLAAIIPHQANIRIIQSASKSLGLPIDHFFVDLHKYGNTSAASIAIALDEYLDLYKSEEERTLILVGFGAGLTWGAARITL